MYGRLCEIEGCGRQHRAGGLCSTHYSRFKRTGVIHNSIPTTPVKRCRAPRCEREQYAYEVCRLHLRRFKTHNDFGPDELLKQPRSPICVTEGCEKKSFRLGLCTRHYKEHKGSTT